MHLLNNSRAGTSGKIPHPFAAAEGINERQLKHNTANLISKCKPGTMDFYTRPSSTSSLPVNLVNILYINLIFLGKIFNSTSVI